MGGIGLITIQLIQGDIVAGVKLVATMYLAVHTLGQSLKPLCFGQRREFVDPGIDGSSGTISHSALIAKDACFHIVEIVLLTLLKGGIITLLLKLLCFQIVAGIKLVADGERYDVQFLQIAPHGQHLQHSILGMVARILGSTLALGNPDILLFLGHSIVDITTHELRGSQCFAQRQATAHGKSLVHAHQSLNPRINQQVIANTNLHGSGIARIHQHHIEECRVEHDVAMIRDERVTLVLIITSYRRVQKRASVGMLTDDIFHHRFHESFLEIKRCLDAHEGQA